MTTVTAVMPLRRGHGICNCQPAKRKGYCKNFQEFHDTNIG
jgi:hypothetical protein